GAAALAAAPARGDGPTLPPEPVSARVACCRRVTGDSIAKSGAPADVRDFRRTANTQLAPAAMSKAQLPPRYLPGSAGKLGRVGPGLSDAHSFPVRIRSAVGRSYDDFWRDSAARNSWRLWTAATPEIVPDW